MPLSLVPLHYCTRRMEWNGMAYISLLHLPSLLAAWSWSWCPASGSSNGRTDGSIQHTEES
jgi:hypothetical protein